MLGGARTLDCTCKVCSTMCVLELSAPREDVGHWRLRVEAQQDLPLAARSAYRMYLWRERLSDYDSK